MERDKEAPAERQPLLETTTKQPRRSTLWTVCPFILGNELCERLAFYGLATNLVTYITQEMGGDSASAGIVVYLFEGSCYLTPLAGAVLADSVWGRYKTILIFSCIYFMGMMMLTLSSCVPGLAPPPSYQRATPVEWAALCVSLLTIIIGTGGIKPNVSAFGADQFDDTISQDRREKASFFNYFYLAVNIGSLVASTAIVYIQDNISWTLGFGLPAMAMFLAVVLFVGGRRGYKHVPATESPMLRVVKVVKAALRNRAKSPSVEAYSRPKLEHLDSSMVMCMPNRRTQDRAGRENSLLDFSPPSKSYRWLEYAITEWQTSQGHVMTAGQQEGYTPKQVEEVKMILRMLPIFFTGILYWTIYGQMGAFFVQEGRYMDQNLNFAGSRFSIPSASMAVFNTLAIILLIPFYDKIVQPGLARMGYKMTLLRRMGWGFFLSIMAMIYSAGIEHWRLLLCEREGCDDSCLVRGDACRNPGAASLNIMWLAPGYLLVGASEVMASIGQLEFFYDQAPDVMRSCCVALGLLSTAFGSYLGAALIWAVQAITEALHKPWLPRDLNQGRLDLFFLLLGALMCVNLMIYCIQAALYEYRSIERKGTMVRAPTIEDHHIDQIVSQLDVPTSAAVAVEIGTSRRTQPYYQEGTPQEWEEYARSLAFRPLSPAIPAPFR